MTPDQASLVAAAVCGVASGALGLLVPTVISRLPEPSPNLEPEAVVGGPKAKSLPPHPPKESYAAIAKLPHLAAKTALSSLVAGAAAGAAVGWGGALLVLLYVVPLGVALALIDWRTTLLPTRLIGPSYVVVAVLVLAAAALDSDRTSLLRAGAGWLLAGGTFLLLWLVNHRGLGYGDVRLSGVLGLALGYLGWPQLVIGLYAGFLVGALAGLLLAALKFVDRKRYPFGPFMLLGGLFGVLFGPLVTSVLGY
ncbi:MAG: A24 family peptidase [Actinomycetota bacterium]|nr:A24 family peptidase [Actinomycetota bacterium]